MKKNIRKKVVAGSMAFILTMGMTGTYGYQRYLNQVYAADTTGLQQVAQDALGDSTGLDGNEVGKEESVYVKADTTGNVTSTTVTEWLRNPGRGELSDVSELSDIKNIKGDETFTEGSNGSLSWKSEGQDIYYQGTTKKELPVEVKLSYKLDGKEITPEDLKGKSGKVEIHIEYLNHSKEIVSVNGNEEEMFTPFTMITAMMLPTDEYTNVTIDSGKIVSDADKNIVVGLGFPGLTENLNLEDLDIDIPESVTITADVKNASVGPTITVASSDIMEKFGLSDVTDFDSFGGSIDELVNAAQQLKDGSEEAAEGAATLSEGADTLAEGAGTLAAGNQSLASGVNTLNEKSGDLISGVNDLAEGITAYTGGVNELAGKSALLADGAQGVSEGAARLQAGIANAKSGADALAAGLGTAKNGVDSLPEGLDSVAGAVGAAKNSLGSITGSSVITEDSKTAIVASATQNVISSLPADLTEEQRAAIESSVREAISGAVDSTLNNQTVTVSGTEAANAYLSGALDGIGQINGKITDPQQGLQSAMNQLYAGALSLQTGLGDGPTGNDGLSNGSAALAEGAGTLAAGTKALAQGAEGLNQNSSLLNIGGSKLKEGGAALASGVSQLAEGADTAAKGAGTLAGGASELAKGASALAEGNRTLADGMAEFKAEGVDKLAEIFDGDISKVTARIQAMSDLGSSYRSFAGIRDGMQGSTKFIIETVGVED